MIGLILFSLLLAILVEKQSEWLEFLIGLPALTVGLLILIISLSLAYFKKVSSIIWHDGFSTGCLLTWYAYWQPQFNDNAPMFFFFPLYFALLTSIVTVMFINKTEYFDQESIAQLRYLDSHARLSLSSIIILVLMSLLITRHYALYPIAMTLFIVRHTLVVCLENIKN